MNRRGRTRATASGDLLWHLIFIFLALLILSIPKQPVAPPSVEKRAEYMLIASWPDDSRSDIDMWYRSPLGEVLSYVNDMIGVASLERDDLGDKNDQIQLPDGSTKVIAINEEAITLRGLIPGQHTINLHAYDYVDPGPIQVRIRLLQVNPYRVLTERIVTMDTDNQELAGFRFTLDAAGRMTGVDYTFERLRNGSKQEPAP